ncbi:hypothetical protein GO986_06605 [Deinococcus sp. HMF7620]|uniref:Intracellular proteinase inhibitor BsuPI domain-containing protein n=1 Tax=Deinococcus arboris TaxID=2682977 RepID=A0A7C9HQZ2_9DEIO|nr:hypothetical protein [Deinococcus arboris]MVN86433.1 hypothetical protein [Deinococcus arboris]
MTHRPSVAFALSSMLAVQMVSAGAATAQGPVQLFIPGRIVVQGTSAPVLTIKVKGLENSSRIIYVEPCQVRFTVFDRTGTALLMYPNAKTLCAQRQIGFNTARGVWSELPLPLAEISKANLQQGRYIIHVHMRATTEQGSKQRALPLLVSNTATLEVK